MRAMLLGFVAIVIVAVASHMVLRQAGFSSQDQNTGAAVRVGADG